MWQLWDCKVRQVEVVGNNMLMIGEWHWLHLGRFSWSIAKSAWQVMTVIPIHKGYTITTRCLDLIANNLSIGSQVQILSASRMTSDRNIGDRIETLSITNIMSWTIKITTQSELYGIRSTQRVCDIVDSIETWNVGDRSWDPAAWTTWRLGPELEEHVAREV